MRCLCLVLLPRTSWPPVVPAWCLGPGAPSQLARSPQWGVGPAWVEALLDGSHEGRGDRVTAVGESQ